MPHEVATIAQIAARHGIQGEPRLLASTGMANDAWEIGNYILRIARYAECDDEAAREAAVVPLLRAAGVRTPELVAVSLRPDIVERPYTIYKRATGVLMSELPGGPWDYPELFREIGRELALSGQVQVDSEARAHLRQDRPLDAGEMMERAVVAGVLNKIHATEARNWIENLTPTVDGAWAPQLIHQDIHPWNILVDPTTLQLTAIIDWGDAAFGDPAGEFAAMPISGVAPAIEGYFQAGGIPDEKLLARSLLRGLSTALWEIRKLPSDVFDRRWWRMPPVGWPELHRKMFEMLSAARDSAPRERAVSGLPLFRA